MMSIIIVGMFTLIFVGVIRGFIAQAEYKRKRQEKVDALIEEVKKSLK
jgi:hypothetical protein